MTETFELYTPFFDTHQVRMCHDEEQREIEWARGNITFHLPAGQDNASFVSQSLFYEAGCLPLQTLLQQSMSSLGMRLCLNSGNFGDLSNQNFMIFVIRITWCFVE